MSIRPRLLVVGAVGAYLVTTLLIGLVRDGVTGEGFAFAVGSLVFYSVAAVLVMRVPENRLSWLLIAVSLGVALLGLMDGSPEDSLQGVIGGFALFALVLPGIGTFIPLWFPTGAPPTPRWRWVGWMATLGVVGVVLGFLLVIYVEGGGSDIESCASVGTCSSIGGLILTLGAIVAAITSLVVRWVRSVGVERLQMKWLVLAFLVFGIGAFAEFGGFQYSVVANIFLPAGMALVPITIGIAVLRYRLYEIDRILSRTVSYALLVALLAGAFFGSVTLLTTLLSPDSDLVTAAATLLVAGLFNPVRRKLQSWVDRRFNRSRYDTERVMDGFASTLQDRIDGDAVITGWTAVVSETMQPTSLSVWVR
jgi:MFS family permease